MVAFRKAVKHESKLRLALAGPAGSGKTFTALTLASALAGDKPVAVVDTERGSASKYADIFSFDVLELDSFHPDRYVEAIRDAATAGYGVVVIDSLSHAWNGTDGLLELVEKIAKRERVNTFQAWGLVKPIENRLVEAITGSNIHVVATMRSKTEYVVEQNERGKATPRKVGTAPIQRDGFEYEFDVFGEMTPDNELIVQKTRCPALAGAVIAKPGRALAETLRTWLSGAPATPAPEPAPAREPTPIRPVERKPEDVIHERIEEHRAAGDGVPLGRAPEAPAKPVKDDPWAPVRELCDALKLSDAERSALFARHKTKHQRAEVLAELRAMKAKAEEPDVTFEVVEPEPAGDNGDPDLLAHEPALQGAMIP